MIYSVQRSKPDGETYLIRYQSEADGGRLDAFCGPLSQDEAADAIANITQAKDWEYESFENNDDYERFEIATAVWPARAWFDAETGEHWSDTP